MLQPKRTKFRKQMKGRNRGLAQRGSKVSFGDFGLKATGRGRITARQIEAARRAMTRHVKRGGKIWIRVFPDKPITAKPLEVRMGSGKGGVEYWVAQIRPGKVLYEMDGVSEELAREAFALAAAKLPITTTFEELNNFVKLGCNHDFCKDCVISTMKTNHSTNLCCALCRAEVKSIESRTIETKNEIDNYIE